MPDDASDFRIKVNIDASGASAGADDSVGQLDRIAKSTGSVEEAAGEAEKGFKNMVREAGTMREADRISMGLFDTMEGGGRTIQGVTEIMRFFLLTAVDLNPELIAATVLLGGMAAAFARLSGEGDKAKTSTDGLKQAAKELNDGITSSIDLMLQKQKEYLDGDKMVLAGLQAETEALNDQLEAWKKKQAAKDLYEDAALANRIATLDDQRATALSGVTNPVQVKAINNNFDDQELALRNDRAIEKSKGKLADAENSMEEASTNVKQKQADLAAPQQQLEDSKRQVQDLQRQIDQITTQRAEGRNFVNAEGLGQNDKKELTYTANDTGPGSKLMQLMTQLSPLAASSGTYTEAQLQSWIKNAASARGAGPQTDAMVKQLQDFVSEGHNKYLDSSIDDTTIQKMKDRLDELSYTQIPDLGNSITKLTGDLTKAQADLEASRTKWDAAFAGVDTAQKDADAKKITQDAKDHAFAVQTTPAGRLAADQSPRNNSGAATARGPDGLPLPPEIANNAQLVAAQRALAMAQKSHPAILEGISSITDSALNNSKMIEALANSVNVRQRQLAAALARAQAAIDSLRHTHDN